MSAELANIYTVTSLNSTTGVPVGMPSSGFMCASDGVLHVFNEGPQDLLIGYGSDSSPAAPTPGNQTLVIKPGVWTITPADAETSAGGGTRLLWAVLDSNDYASQPTWGGMKVWWLP